MSTRSMLKKVKESKGIKISLVFSLVALLVGVVFPTYAFAGKKKLSLAAPGTVLKTEPMTVSPTLAALATAKRIKYISRDINNKPIKVTGVVLTPHNRPARTHIVAWAHGTLGIADKCAASKFPNLDADPASTVYADTIATYLEKGWVVTATDYEGLGTKGIHPYVVGKSEGQAVIDSVRAARNLDRTLSKKWVVSGHSQGGQAALFAGELADDYAPELKLRAVVAIAPASNLELIAQLGPGTPGQGYIAMAVFGFAAVDSEVQPEEVLAPPAYAHKDLILKDGCYLEILGAYENFTPEELLRGGQFSEEMLAKFAAQNPAQEANTAPVLLVQGEADESIPLGLTELLHSQECAVNTVSTRLNTYPGQGHDQVLSASASDVTDFMTARFNGEEIPGNCP